jgi:hypothetical protein
VSRRLCCLLVAALALAAMGASPAAAAPVAGALVRYWSFSAGHADLRDAIVYWAPGPFHVQLEEWSWAHGESQFRPEVGIHLRDARRSAYTLQWRHERDDERFWAGSEQVVGKRFVLRGEVSPLVFRDSTLVSWDAGADVYFGSYGFAGATLMRDPREGGLWVVPVRARLATEANDWVQFTLAPASKRTVGWAVDAKFRWLKLGVERNSRFDFTNLDNTIWTAGLEVPLPATR